MLFSVVVTAWVRLRLSVRAAPSARALVFLTIFFLDQYLNIGIYYIYCVYSAYPRTQRGGHGDFLKQLS